MLEEDAERVWEREREQILKFSGDVGWALAVLHEQAERHHRELMQRLADWRNQA